MNQWFFKISQYSQELLDGLNQIGNWPENVKSMQQNWIGRSEGAEFTLEVVNSKLKIEVFCFESFDENCKNPNPI